MVTSGKVFLDTVFFNAEDFFHAEFIDSETEDESCRTKISIQAEGNKSEETEVTKRIATVERETIGLKENLQKRRFQDSMVMSRIREELDFASNTNTKKEDRIIITGLTCLTPAPTLSEEKRSG
jgi:hypothetical protein